MARTFPWERLSSADTANFTFEHPDQAYSIGIVATLDAASLVDASGTPDLGRLRGAARTEGSGPAALAPTGAPHPLVGGLARVGGLPT